MEAGIVNEVRQANRLKQISLNHLLLQGEEAFWKYFTTICEFSWNLEVSKRTLKKVASGQTTEMQDWFQYHQMYLGEIGNTAEIPDFELDVS